MNNQKLSILYEKQDFETIETKIEIEILIT